MKHPIWGPICWMILSRLMHVHKPVLHAKALSTPSWPICSLFIYPIFYLSSISLSLFLWQCRSHHISVDCLDLSHWCLPHKRVQSNVCTILYCMRHPSENLSSAAFSEACRNRSMGTRQWTYSIIRWACPAQRLVTAVCRGRQGKDGMGQGERDDLSRRVSPRQRVAERGGKIAALLWSLRLTFTTRLLGEEREILPQEAGRIGLAHVTRIQSSLLPGSPQTSGLLQLCV